MNIPLEIRIPALWGDYIFKKSEWGEINYLVGPNGTGKSLFAEQLKVLLPNHGLQVRYLHSDRLVSWTQQQHLQYLSSSLLQGGLNFDWFPDLKSGSRSRGEVNDAFVLLKENLNVRIKVESILSQLLNRSIILEERGGILVPTVSKGKGDSYSFKEEESHGLKEIITLITLLYDESYNCFIIDEPDLHLHPQFQTFFLKIVRDFAGNPLEDETKKCFFFATHSPNFLDIRTIEDLKNVIIFSPEHPPTYVDSLDANDEYKLKQLLPRLNTHHKQFFFSPRPIFVEGYTDQQIFSFIQEKRKKLLDYNGPTFIDVQGKDELDLFFRLCKKLSIDAQIITDLDALVKGRLRESVSHDEKCKAFLQTAGVGVEFLKSWGEIAQKTDDCVKEFLKSPSNNLSGELLVLHETLKSESEIEKQRYIFLVALKRLKQEFLDIIKLKAPEITFISGRIEKIINGFKKAGVHVLEKGQLENYYSQSVQNPFRISDKVKTQLFNTERDYLLQNDPDEKEIKKRYDGIIDILDTATSGTKVDYKRLLLRYIRKFIYDIQDAFNFGEITDVDSIRNHKRINYSSYSKILDIVNFLKSDSTFTCTLKIKGFEDFNNISIDFTEKNNPSEINF
ncbi:MAG: AAA family ATPase [Thaumarchaeota archaeon]|nr:AAA family ATPase [Nitrososphaerota archaeon]